MKFLHLSDLHFGKSLHGISLIDNKDQVYWKDRFLEKVEELQPDAIVIAGDIYDRSAPSGDAVELLYCRPPGFTVVFPGKYLAGGLQSGCTANLTGA